MKSPLSIALSAGTGLAIAAITITLAIVDGVESDATVAAFTAFTVYSVIAAAIQSYAVGNVGRMRVSRRPRVLSVPAVVRMPVSISMIPSAAHLVYRGRDTNRDSEPHAIAV
jgi:hypothetical protein